jgi:transposase
MTIVADTTTPAPVDVFGVTIGVDTHADFHVAAVIDPLGRHLGHATFDTTVAGFKALLAWANEFGPITLAGVEGTGAYGAGLARFLTAENVVVVEVDRPDRKTRRDQGKSDPIDAYAAARAAASGRASGIPKARTGDVEAIRVLRVARTGAVRARARALTQLKSLIVTAPDALRAQLAGLDGTKLVTTCARLRPVRGAAPRPSPFAKRPPRPGRLIDPTAATKRSLASIAGRVQQLDVEIAELDDDLEALLKPLAPTLLELMGVGLDVAGQLLVTAGDNPDRFHSEAAFAHLCGVAPIPANSGKNQNNFRLNRGGDRAANAALYRIVLCRLRHDAATRAYVERRTKQGKSKKDIIRCLKRYVAREVYAAVQADLSPDITP